jgi:hypothetical protein
MCHPRRRQILFRRRHAHIYGTPFEHCIVCGRQLVSQRYDVACTTGGRLELAEVRDCCYQSG